MIRRVVPIVVLVLFVFSIVPVVAAATKPPAKKTISAVCPVMGTKIPDVSKAAGKSVYKGKTYYFCCKGCKPAFDKNPEKYLKKTGKKNAAAVGCPVTGKQCAVKNGQKDCPYGARAGSCPVGKAKATTVAAKKPVSAVCPVMNSKIPDVSKAAGKSVYKGKTYYFCCKGCKPMFDKNPEKYLKKTAKK